MIVKKHKPKPKGRNEKLFERMVKRILYIPFLKIFELNISWMKGFGIKVEFFEKKEEKETK